MRPALALLLLLLAAGCAPNAVSGSVKGASLEVAEAVSFNIDEEYVIRIRSSEGICADAKSEQWPKNATWITLSVYSRDANGVKLKLAPGTYAIGTPSTLPAAESHATFHVNDATCELTMGESAKSGFVTLDTLGDASTPTTGSFDLSFGEERVTGQFEATVCDSGRTGGGASATCR